ncbi:MAG: hypothetical protein BMS9Abin37_3276 [Acidobacteriota bacterium]|nr:MAG: hypothetical protein BMS9Abin37_3276 [Acidobacteriota bacterium]
MGSVIVILAYLAVLAVVLSPPKNLRSEEEEGAPWWRNVRFWASVVVVVQIVVYAVWG